MNEDFRPSLMQFAHEMLLLSIGENRKSDPHSVESLYQKHPDLNIKAGAFLTIYIQGGLRGCLGELEPNQSLGRVVSKLAFKVPQNDFRFKPVVPDEIAGLTFKLSILSFTVPVGNPNQIRLGQHGLIAEYQNRRGVFLPDVPIEQGWNLDQYLSGLRHKARIQPGIPWSEIQLTCFTTLLLNSVDYPFNP